MPSTHAIRSDASAPRPAEQFALADYLTAERGPVADAGVLSLMLGLLTKVVRALPDDSLAHGPLLDASRPIRDGLADAMSAAQPAA
jgi:hypothetical protein